MLRRVEVAPRPDAPDMVGRKVASRIKEFLGIENVSVRVITVYTVSGLAEAELDRVIAAAALHDPVLHQVSLCPPAPLARDFDWIIEKGFRPGVTDNEGRTARETLALVTGGAPAADLAVYASRQYCLSGGLSREQVEHIARDLLANELIERFEIKSRGEWDQRPGFEPRAAQVLGEAHDAVESIDLFAMDDAALVEFSRANTLALSLDEMRVLRDWFARPEVQARRAAQGLGPQPTDAEIECLAQTWSEHCKHKIFTATIDYDNTESGKRSRIHSLFKTCIQQPTQLIRDRRGADDFCLSVFKDNAGVIRLTDEHNVCIKVETHNSPSALDPYGGALTGIVGVNRDPMGTGLGANMLCNTDVFCFASPFHKGELPPRLLHPRRVLEGVREGVEHGGNKSGIPTVNGSIVFHERFLGKPLVFCGTIGVMPREILGRLSHEKAARVGDAIVMIGGRIGKDGIHGATFSSEELHEGSPRETLDEFLALAGEMAVEASVLGQFTDSGALAVRYGDKPVAHLDMAFLHEGLPPMVLKARWEKPASKALELPEIADHGALLERMLGRLNICSKEYVIRQYDHEVKGMSAVKPLVGPERDGPADAAVLRPVLDRPEGLVVSHGICPKFSDRKISIPPTLLFSAVGVIDDVARAQTSDFKQPGDLIYLLGVTFDELGGSELADELGLPGGQVPQVDGVAALDRYRRLSQAIRSGLVSACHDVSDGGLAVALAEMAIAGRLGARVDLDKVPTPSGGLDATTLLYSESSSRLLATVKPERQEAFESLFADSLDRTAGCVGVVTARGDVVATQAGAILASVPATRLAAAWKAPLAW